MLCIWSCLVLALAIGALGTSDLLRCPTQYDQPYVYPGDVYLGVFVPIHDGYRKSKTYDWFARLDKLGYKFLEAILTTLDEINSRKNYLNYKLGAVVYDTCNNPELAIREALNFIWVNCSDSSRLLTANRLVHDPWQPAPMMAFIGPAYDGPATEVANLMKLFLVPQVGFLSATNRLANRDRYSTLYHTVPSVKYLIKTMLRLLKHYQWLYVNLITDNSEYGQSSESILREELKGTYPTVCLDEVISLRQANSENHNVVNSVRSLLGTKATVNLILATNTMAIKVIETIRYWQHADRERFLWILPNMVVDELSHLALRHSKRPSLPPHFPALPRLVLIVPQLTGRDALKSYALRTDRSYPEKSWVDEYLFELCGCLPDTGEHEQSGLPACGGAQQEWCKRRLNADSPFYYPNVANAVLSVAAALKRIHDDCGGCLPRSDVLTRIELMDTMERYGFQGFGNATFSFNNQGEAFPRFSIVAFLYHKQIWRVLGEYDADLGEDLYKIDKSADSYIRKHNPPSVCSQQCPLGQVTVMSTEKECCWECRSCKEKQVVRRDHIPSSESMDSACEYCPPGHRPSENLTVCESLQWEYMSIVQPPAIAIVTLCMLTIILWSFSIFVYTKHWKTPVVKASGRETTIVLFVGIFFSFLSPMVLLSFKPSKLVCTWATIAPGLCSVISYSAIYVRINLIDRMFRMTNQPAYRPKKFINPQSQLLFMGLICLSEVTMLLITTSIWPPNATQLLVGYENKTEYVSDGVVISSMLTHNQYICFKTIGIPQFTGMLIPLLLMFLTLMHAYKIRKVPSGYNEARALGVVNYVNAFLIVFFGTVFALVKLKTIELLPLCVLLLASGINQLTILILPKIYTLIFQPQKNSNAEVFRRIRSQSQAETIAEICERSERHQKYTRMNLPEYEMKQLGVISTSDNSVRTNGKLAVDTTHNGGLAKFRQDNSIVPENVHLKRVVRIRSFDATNMRKDSRSD